MKSKQIVVGMSGGVDSSIALILLKQKGWKPVGVSLKLPVWESERNRMRENACCTDKSLRIAKRVCKKFGAEHHVYDVRREFECSVMDYFVNELKSARTPNPCVICNRQLKFKKLFEWAHAHGIEYVTTGHYARVRLNRKSRRAELMRAKDKGKDQSYGLAFLTQEWLAKTKFPLGEYTKKQILKIAKRKGLAYLTKRKQSQNLCFVAGAALPHYLEERIGRKPGKIIDESGKFLGRHKGLHLYTIGQSKRLNLPYKYYVKAFDVPKNKLIVTRNRKALLKKQMMLSQVHFISSQAPKKKVEILAQVRSKQKPSKATLHPPEQGKAKVVFKRAQEMLTPGQLCAFYKGDVCLGGGMIEEVK
ncbi:tRNA 2-thiouridine(34) synthase MnmA [Candidatus Micrarchaeota archaeon]|nr:MAG: tRNA 2-thiouridine(34) synthase MnmA [Candidatus Micrarchaeota archaeon]